VGLLEEVIEARAYAQTKAQWDAAESKTDVPESPMLELVKRVDFAIAEEDLAGA